MPDFGSSTFSQTDSGNATGTQPSWSGSANPNTIDDAGRALQGAVTREWNWRSFTLTAGGTADAKTLTYSVAPAAYYNGQRFAFIANTTNTGSATLNVNALGAKTIRSMLTGTLTNLASGDMVAGMYVEVAYNTANDCFAWVNQTPVIAAASETVAGRVELATNAEVQTGTDTARAVTPAGLAAKEASAAEWRNNTADRILTTDQAWSAAGTVALTDAATVAVDMNAGLNFTLTLGGNRTLGQPTNTKVGQTGFIRINQDGTGSRTLAYHADWKFAGGNDPVLTTTASATDILFYQVIAANFIYASLVKGVA